MSITEQELEETLKRLGLQIGDTIKSDLNPNDLCIIVSFEDWIENGGDPDNTTPPCILLRHNPNEHSALWLMERYYYKYKWHKVESTEPAPPLYLTPQFIKAANTNPIATICIKCKGPLKDPCCGPTFKYCPVCEP